VQASRDLKNTSFGSAERGKIKVDFQIANIELAIFRIVKDAWLIHRHSGSAPAAIRIRREGARLIVGITN
jgi:hypothetical protein